MSAGALTGSPFLVLNINYTSNADLFNKVFPQDGYLYLLFTGSFPPQTIPAVVSLSITTGNIITPKGVMVGLYFGPGNLVSLEQELKPGITNLFGTTYLTGAGVFGKDLSLRFTNYSAIDNFPNTFYLKLYYYYQHFSLN